MQKKQADTFPCIPWFCNYLCMILCVSVTLCEILFGQYSSAILGLNGNWRSRRPPCIRLSVSDGPLHRRDLTGPTRGTMPVPCVGLCGSLASWPAPMRPVCRALRASSPPRSERRAPLRRYPAAWKAAFPVSALRGALTGKAAILAARAAVERRPESVNR